MSKFAQNKHFRQIVYTLSLIFVLFFSACNLNLQWPKEIEIIMETPDVRIGTGFDALKLDDFFKDIDTFFAGSGKTKIIDCSETDILTKIIYIELFNADIPHGLANSLLNENGGKIPSSVELLRESVKVKSPSLTGTNLDGFSMDSLNARLYISGENPDILDAFVFKLEIDGGGGKEFRRSPPSGITAPYSGTSLPGNSNNLQISFDSDEIEVIYSIYLREGYEIKPGFFSDSINVLFELAVWTPFIFTADKETLIELPFDSLFTDADIFGRTDPDDDSILDMIDNIQLDIILSENPFPNSILQLKFGTKTIESAVTSNTIRINIEKKDLIDNLFKPSFFIVINKGGQVIIPRELSVEELAFKAKVRFVMDAPELPELPEWWPWK